MKTAREILEALRLISAPSSADDVRLFLFEFGFMLEELDILDADPGTLRGIASEMERLAAPEAPAREYPSLNLWRRLERRPAAVPYRSEPLRIAAMYEAAASDADREAQYWLGRLHEPGATACIESSIRAADDAMRRAAGVLAKAELEVRHAA